MISESEATNLLLALDALDELEQAALKMVRAEIECGPVIDGLMADPLTEGSRLDLLYVVDTLVADLLTAMGRTVGTLLQEAPASSARDALTAHLSEQG